MWCWTRCSAVVALELSEDILMKSRSSANRAAADGKFDRMFLMHPAGVSLLATLQIWKRRTYAHLRVMECYV